MKILFFLFLFLLLGCGDNKRTTTIIKNFVTEGSKPPPAVQPHIDKFILPTIKDIENELDRLADTTNDGS